MLKLLFLRCLIYLTFLLSEVATFFDLKLPQPSEVWPYLSTRKEAPPRTPHLRPTRAVKSSKETCNDSSIKSQEASWWSINTSFSSPHRLFVSIQELCLLRRKLPELFRLEQKTNSSLPFLSILSRSWGCVGEHILFDIRHRREPRGEKVAANWNIYAHTRSTIDKRKQTHKASPERTEETMMFTKTAWN